MTQPETEKDAAATPAVVITEPCWGKRTDQQWVQIRMRCGRPDYPWHYTSQSGTRVRLNKYGQSENGILDDCIVEIAPVVITACCLGKRRGAQATARVVVKSVGSRVPHQYSWFYTSSAGVFPVTDCGRRYPDSTSPDDIVEIYPLPTYITDPCVGLRAGGGEVELAATNYPHIFEYQAAGRRVFVYVDGSSMTEQAASMFCRIPENDIVEIWLRGMDLLTEGVRLPKIQEQGVPHAAVVTAAKAIEEKARKMAEQQNRVW